MLTRNEEENWMFIVNTLLRDQLSRLKNVQQCIGSSGDIFSCGEAQFFCKVLPIPANQYWPLFLLGVKNAFLDGNRDGWRGRGYKLKKAIYFLKQSPCAWLQKCRLSNVELVTLVKLRRPYFTCEGWKRNHSSHCYIANILGTIRRRYQT